MGGCNKMCPHLQAWCQEKNFGPRPAQSLAKALRSSRFNFGTPVGGHPGALRCSTCKTCVGRLLACLQCSGVCCVTHMAEHAELRGASHSIGVDTERGELFCSPCKDYVYMKELDRAVAGGRAAAAGQPEGACRKRRGDRKEQPHWVPTSADLKEIDKRGQAVVLTDELGLRGLNNLGNTCFMSSVLQALMRIPPLQEYFLADRHSPQLCRAQNDDDSVCLGCEMSKVFDEAYKGIQEPFSPASFLYSWWRHAESQSERLACYEQQDAHEFYLSAVGALHAADAGGAAQATPRSKGSGSIRSPMPNMGLGALPWIMSVTEERGVAQGVAAGTHSLASPRSGRDGDDCHCIIHRIFTGTLRSDVMCGECGHTSTAFDPCVDLSLDFPSSSSSSDPISLTSCLEHFIRPERLSSRLRCQQCQALKESLKQMAIQRLPPVLCFHIKRFEHSSSRHSSRKISRHLAFPLHSLDMAPFLSSAILQSRFGHRVTPEPSSASDPAGNRVERPVLEYELAAVVEHSGQLEGGHYVAYVQSGGRWYLCNDQWVTRVHESTVRNCEAYLLYYVSKSLCNGNERSIRQRVSKAQ
ncbi:ubiquitin-specific protease ubp2 [Cymbomonas tetramitiformis]|uniref:Ubiquitin carboxyl-terminal hydrolase n=1 Tax=Cymbomonas tetramitiformis TaxID=36881 RepID=A0AAE0LCX8_9CHLO|nr:ubiquitin-specific protease ubp2 [Cymbomonas tetramitiformis]